MPDFHCLYARLPEVRNNYAKIQSIQFEEFAGCLSWWRNRGENERAWPMPVARIIENWYNLNANNPNAKEDSVHLPPERLVEDCVRNE